MGLELFCGRRYAVGLFAGIIVYAAVAAAVEYSPAIQGVSRVAIGLLPTVPLIFCAVWVMREYRTGDELQKRVTADGVLFAFVVTAVVSLSYGFLQVVVELPVVNATFGWAVMGSAWVVGSFIARRDTADRVRDDHLDGGRVPRAPRASSVITHAVLRRSCS